MSIKFCPLCRIDTTELVPVPGWATAEVCQKCAEILRQAREDGWEAAKAERLKIIAFPRTAEDIALDRRRAEHEDADECGEDCEICKSTGATGDR